jgi:type II secretory pathway pseudopilin PulG
MTRRAGHLLAEALCALALSGVLAAAAAVALSGVRRRTAASDARAESTRAAREAALIVAALAPDAEQVRLEGDTALALDVRIAASVACGVGPAFLTLPPSAVASERPLTIRSQPIEAGDEIAVLVRDSADVAGRWWHARLDSVQSRASAEPCGSALGWVAPEDAAAARLVVFTTPVPEAAIVPGAPVRIGRAGRLALYPSGSGEWMLGWRRCAGMPRTCGAIQPVAGPLRTPGSGGLRLRWDPAEGGLVVEARAPGAVAPVRTVVALRDAPS